MQRRKVLVVEDDESIRAAVAYCLRKSGYTVLLSGDGLDALACIREQEVRLVILDLSLPQMDGFGLLEHLRTEPDLSAVAAIVLTAFEDEVNRRRSFELGAKRFITKPFSPRELVAAVGEVMGAPIAGKERKPPGKEPPGPQMAPAFAIGMGAARTQANPQHRCRSIDDIERPNLEQVAYILTKKALTMYDRSEKELSFHSTATIATRRRKCVPNH